MIASLKGKIILKDLNYIIVECSGVGFKCFVTQTTHSKSGQVGDDVFLYTYMSVKEDAIDLFGFSELGELEAFKLIISVSGVGAKIGLALLSQFTYESLMINIASGDAKALTAASGVGIKLAQRIILELKDKVGSIAVSGEAVSEIKAVGNASSNTNSKEAVEALVSLGYSLSEASLAVGKLDQSLDIDALIKGALKLLAGRF